MKRRPFVATTILLAVFLIVCATQVRADLSQKDARKAIATMAGWSLPNSTVRIGRLNMNGAAVAETTADLQLVFRFSQHREGYWQINEVRVGQDRWERLEVIAEAAKLELSTEHCDVANEFRGKARPTDLTNRQARCLVATLFGVKLPSDAVRIKEISSLGLPLGSQPSAVAVALVRMDFRFARDRSGWHVSDCRTGNQDWIAVTSVPAELDRIKRSIAAREMDAIGRALDVFRRDRGFFVVSDKHSVLIDQLSPRYLSYVTRLDPWSRPYQYKGERDHFSLRSVGPDGKSGTGDDVVLAGPTR